MARSPRRLESCRSSRACTREQLSAVAAFLTGVLQLTGGCSSFAQNRFGGELPESIAKLTKLRRLFGFSNNVTHIPDVFHAKMSLEEMYGERARVGCDADDPWLQRVLR